MRKFKIFGLHIVISRDPIKAKPRSRNRNDYRNSQRTLRREMTDNCCEVCGKPLGKSCYLHRTLPQGAPDRNLVDNIRVLCGACWHELEKKPHIHGYQHLELTGNPNDQ